MALPVEPAPLAGSASESGSAPTCVDDVCALDGFVRVVADGDAAHARRLRQRHRRLVGLKACQAGAWAAGWVGPGVAGRGRVWTRREGPAALGKGASTGAAQPSRQRAASAKQPRAGAPLGQAHTKSILKRAASRSQEWTMLLPSPTYTTWAGGMWV